MLLPIKEDAVVKEVGNGRSDYCVGAGKLNAAGWVLGALDPADTARFADHLQTCRSCQLTVAELESAGRLLRMMSPAVRAPACLKTATLARIRQAAGHR